jgi:hypothetical protein
MPAGVSAYVPLANITLGATAATVTFSSINQSYRDLVVVFTGTNNLSATDLVARVNSDTGANYLMVRASGNGTARSSAIFGTETRLNFTAIAQINTTEIQTTIINFMDYSATDKHKTTISRANRAGAGTEMFANRWANTAAITSIQFYCGVNSFAAGSTFALYGVSA